MGITLPANITMALLAILEAGPERREELVNVFISDRWEQWKGIALQQCRASGRSYNVYLDDVTTLVGLTVWKLVTEIVAEEPEVLRSKSRNLNYLIQKNVRNSVRSFFYSEAGGAAVAGMDNVIRRRLRSGRPVYLTSRGMLEPLRRNHRSPNTVGQAEDMTVKASFSLRRTFSTGYR
jgi:hypothetical protein